MGRAVVVALRHREVRLVAAAVEVMVVRAGVHRRHAAHMVAQAAVRHARVRTVVHRAAQCPVVMDTDRMELLMAKVALLQQMGGNRMVIRKAPFVRRQGNLAVKGSQLHARRHRKASSIVMRPRRNIVRLRFAWFQDIAHQRNSIIRQKYIAHRRSITFVRLNHQYHLNLP
jgi:hypothetical protein